MFFPRFYPLLFTLTANEHSFAIITAVPQVSRSKCECNFSFLFAFRVLLILEPSAANNAIRLAMIVFICEIQQ